MAIGVVAGSADEPAASHGLSRREEIGCGLGAAVGFGTYLILISETSDGAGLWTVVAARVAPVIVLGIVLTMLRRPLMPDRPALPLVTLSGVTDAGANALLLVAVRTGMLTVVAPVANLYPAVTVVLAAGSGTSTSAGSASRASSSPSPASCSSRSDGAVAVRRRRATRYAASCRPSSERRTCAPTGTGSRSGSAP